MAIKQQIIAESKDTILVSKCPIERELLQVRGTADNDDEIFIISRSFLEPEMKIDVVTVMMHGACRCGDQAPDTSTRSMRGAPSCLSIFNTSHPSQLHTHPDHL